jgi:hypothetical protein
MNRRQERQAAARERALVGQVRDALRVRASILGLNPRRANPSPVVNRQRKAVRP